jgi:hypothetical protein
LKIIYAFPICLMRTTCVHTIWSSYQYLVQRTSYEAPHFTVFSISKCLFSFHSLFNTGRMEWWNKWRIMKDVAGNAHDVMAGCIPAMSRSSLNSSNRGHPEYEA